MFAKGRVRIGNMSHRMEIAGSRDNNCPCCGVFRDPHSGVSSFSSDSLSNEFLLLFLDTVFSADFHFAHMVSLPQDMEARVAFIVRRAEFLGLFVAANKIHATSISLQSFTL